MDVGLRSRGQRLEMKMPLLIERLQSRASSWDLGYRAQAENLANQGHTHEQYAAFQETLALQ